MSVLRLSLRKIKVDNDPGLGGLGEEVAGTPNAICLFAVAAGLLGGDGIAAGALSFPITFLDRRLLWGIERAEGCSACESVCSSANHNLPISISPSLGGPI